MISELAKAGEQLDKLWQELQLSLDGLRIEDDPTSVAAFKLTIRAVQSAALTANALSRVHEDKEVQA